MIVASLGLLVIVGSGGGNWCFDYCLGPWPYPPSVDVAPARVTVQVGDPVTFTGYVDSSAVNPPSLQWCRQAKGSSTCSDIPGATSTSYALTAANLADDGAVFQLTATDPNGKGQAGSKLAVSSAPGIPFQDGEFLDSNWTATAVVDPAENGPAHTESRSVAGGNPDAYRSVTYSFSRAPGSTRLYHESLPSTYDPSVHGAIYVLDFNVDCVRLSSSTAPGTPYVTAMIEQAGRRFVAHSTHDDWRHDCSDASWDRAPTLSSLGAGDFVLDDGPACSPSETCPDFSAQAAPVRMGFVTGAEVNTASSTGNIVQGIDNWRVTVWRR